MHEFELSFVLPLLLLGISYAVAARFEQKIPRRLKVYRFHVILYSVVTILGLTAALLMGLSPYVDGWVDDAAIYLELLFGISGIVLCVVFAPVLWWLERRPDQTKARWIGLLAISGLMIVPYFLIAAILLFYRE